MARFLLAALLPAAALSDATGGGSMADMFKLPIDQESVQADRLCEADVLVQRQTVVSADNQNMDVGSKFLSEMPTPSPTASPNPIVAPTAIHGTVEYNFDDVLDPGNIADFVAVGNKDVGLQFEVGRSRSKVVVYDVEGKTVVNNTDPGLHGRSMWLTSVGVGNKVVGLPWRADKVVVYDVENNTVEYNTDGGLSGSNMWYTSVGVGNKVVGLPCYAGKVVVYDVEAKTVEYNTDGGLSGSIMWVTSVGVGNKVVGLPFDAGKVVVYDVETKTVEYNTDGGLSGSDMWRTSVGVGNKVVGLPWDAGKVVVYDVEGKTVEYNTDPGINGTDMCMTSVGVGNEVVGLPYNAGKVVVYDVETKTVEYNTDGGLSGQYMWWTSVGVGNKVVGLPSYAGKVVVYDVETKTVEYNTDGGLSGNGICMTSVGVGNKAVGLPYNAGKVVVYDVETKTVEYNSDGGFSGTGMWWTSVGVGNKVVGLPWRADKVVVFESAPTTAPTTALPTPVLSDAPHHALQLAENSLGAVGGIMRFDDIMEDGTQLVMENVTEYAPFKPNITGLTAPNSSMAQINLGCGDKVEMVFSFLLASEPKSMDNFDFTVADLDRGAHERCAEMVEVVGYTNYSLYPSSSIQVEPGTEPGTPFLFIGTAGGSSADNPENIETMTDEQKSKTVSFVIKNRETFTVLFSTTEPGVSSDDPDVVGYSGRRILFGFGTP